MKIALNLLEDHPGNANRMPPAMFVKLAAHLRESGRYPPLIVRPLPASPGAEQRYQILDGHHRAAALRELGIDAAECQVWSVDDREADLLLVTLNRLRGEDDPRRRGAILERLASSMGVTSLAALSPENAARLKKLIASSHPPPPLAAAPRLDSMPQAVTFFLSVAQRRRLMEKLDRVCPNRSQALAQVLELGA